MDFQKPHEFWREFLKGVNLGPTANSLLNLFRSYGSTKSNVNTVFDYFEIRSTCLACDHNNLAFTEWIFKNLMRYGKNF